MHPQTHPTTQPPAGDLEPTATHTTIHTVIRYLGTHASAEPYLRSHAGLCRGQANVHRIANRCCGVVGRCAAPPTAGHVRDDVAIAVVTDGAVAGRRRQCVGDGVDEGGHGWWWRCHARPSAWAALLTLTLTCVPNPNFFIPCADLASRTLSPADRGYGYGCSTMASRASTFPLADEQGSHWLSEQASTFPLAQWAGEYIIRCTKHSTTVPKHTGTRSGTFSTPTVPQTRRRLSAPSGEWSRSRSDSALSSSASSTAAARLNSSANTHHEVHAHQRSGSDQEAGDLDTGFGPP